MIVYSQALTGEKIPDALDIQIEKLFEPNKISSNPMAFLIITDNASENAKQTSTIATTTKDATVVATSPATVALTPSINNKKLPSLPENVLAQLIDLYGLDFSIIAHVPSVKNQTFVTIKQIPPL